MFAFAGAMVVVIGIFALMSIFYYEYVDYSHEEDDKTPSFSDVETDEVSNDKMDYTNYGYKKDNPWDTDSANLRM